MDPISLAIGAVGLGLQIFGSHKSSQASAEAAAISRDEASQEININSVKQQQMELEGRRANIETARNAQRARAMGINAAVNQGAQFGSGIQGGLASTEDQAMFHMQGVNDSLSFGRQINVFNNNISNDKMQMAGVQSEASQAQGLTSLGGAIMKAGPIIGQISQGFGGNSYGGLAAGRAFNNSNSNSSYYGPLN